MPQRHARLKHALLYAGLLCLSLGLGLSYPTINRLLSQPPPRPGNVDVSTVQSWMTIPHIAKTYRYPARELFRQLDLDPESSNKHSLAAIAIEKGVPTEEIITQVRTILSVPPPKHD